MLRRSFLVFLTVAGIALAAPVFAQNGGVPGLDDALKTGEPVMIHVTTPWCGTCQAQKPIVAALLASSDFKNVRRLKSILTHRKTCSPVTGYRAKAL